MRCFSDWYLFVCGAALMLALPVLPARAEPYAPRVGQRHADFTLPTINDGSPVSLSRFHGKKVLLIQFASW